MIQDTEKLLQDIQWKFLLSSLPPATHSPPHRQLMSFDYVWQSKDVLWISFCA